MVTVERLLFLRLGFFYWVACNIHKYLTIEHICSGMGGPVVIIQIIVFETPSPFLVTRHPEQWTCGGKRERRIPYDTRRPNIEAVRTLIKMGILRSAPSYAHAFTQDDAFKKVWQREKLEVEVYLKKSKQNGSTGRKISTSTYHETVKKEDATEI
jgi:hypothetical protein